jgi:hypothetical protein
MFGSHIVRFGTNSTFSHTEIMFEPGDGVDHLMPDGTTAPDEEGRYWFGSATAMDVMDLDARHRPGKTGGVRFKRIKPDPLKWVQQDLPKNLYNPVFAAEWFVEHEGLAYDWRHIASFTGAVGTQLFSQGDRHWTCAEACAAALRFPEAFRFHPGNLPPVVARMTLTYSFDGSIKANKK